MISVTDAELQLANDIYDEVDRVLSKSTFVRAYLADQAGVPDSSLQAAADTPLACAEDVCTAMDVALGLLGRLINQIEGRDPTS